MELLLQRQPAVDLAILGTLAIDGVTAYHTLERAGVEIAAGRYPVRFTVSGRAERGELWSPDPDHRLPLIDQVPGRSGLRFHALNEALESDGCIGLGQRVMGITIRQSRPAITDFVEQLREALARREAVFVTIQNPTTERTLRA